MQMKTCRDPTALVEILNKPFDILRGPGILYENWIFPATAAKPDIFLFKTMCFGKDTLQQCILCAWQVGFFQESEV